MKETTEVKEYKGYKINIYPDDIGESPDDWGDNNLFLVGYHRDFWVDRSRRDKDGKSFGGINKELAQEIAAGGERSKDYTKKYHIFGLEAYIHSGVVLALSQEGNFCDRQWDVSQLGMVFVAKEEWKTREKARQAARGLIETWNDYLSGNVYGYMIENPDGEESGGCWGYYGDPDKSGLVESAQDEIEAALKDDAEKKKIATQAMA